MERLGRVSAPLVAVVLLTVLPGGGPSATLRADCDGIFAEAIGQVAPDVGFERLAATGACPALDEWHAGWADIRVLSERGVFGRALRPAGGVSR